MTVPTTAPKPGIAAANVRKKPAGRRRILPALLVTGVMIMGAASLPGIARNYIYPREYTRQVETCSEKYGVDECLIYAVIKTESGFDPGAQSDVGARGLMQLMEDAYDWVGSRMGDKRGLSYDHMYVPDYNIEYGTYLLMLLCEEYGDMRTAVAAYHSGRGTVNEWLQNPDYSADGVTLDRIPAPAAAHYADKVMRAYAAYKNLYD